MKSRQSFNICCFCVAGRLLTCVYLIEYTIRKLFDSAQEQSVLTVGEAEKFYIPPYQRGYKWKSYGNDSQVRQLMDDLFSAYSNSLEHKKRKYYLQFITVQQKEVENIKVLELIDGQQRVTTLTILLSVFQEKTPLKEQSIATNLLPYEVRRNVSEFIDKFIYNNINIIVNTEWNDFIAKNEKYNEQDIWHIFEVAKLVNKFLEDNLENENYISAFRDFLLDNVIVLVNFINLGVSAEDIFANLNSNKVELTNSELLKGLFLTFAARDKDILSKKNHKETRGIMGRQWDEVSYWTNKPGIKQLFFSKTPFI